MQLTKDTATPLTKVLGWESISAPVRPFLDEVKRRLEAEADAFEPEISAFVRYALAGSGKQLRPMLVALGGGVGGRAGEPQVTAAVVIEMVHLATLVHDDVMDEASLRRKRPTLSANWGNEIAVLAGDCLFARALQRSAEFPTTDICRAISQAAGTVCTGEILQTLRRGNYAISKTEYLRVVGMKTAELFKELSKKHSLMVVEHDMDFIEALDCRVTVLHEGSVLAEGSLANVKNNQQVIEVYLGR